MKPQTHKIPLFQPKILNSVAACRLVAAARLILRGRRHPAHLLKASKEISYACQGISVKYNELLQISVVFCKI